MNAQVAIVRCPDYAAEPVHRSVREAIALLGGVTRFIQPRSKVLVKPNLLMSAPVEAGINTHPEVVRGVIKALKEIDCRIYVGDAPSVWDGQDENVDKVHEQSGIKQVCMEEGVELVKFSRRHWRHRFPLTTWLNDCAYLVSVPKFKTHQVTLLTGGVKNLFGLVVGTFKTELHKKYFLPEEFSRMLVDLYLTAKPALTVVDGIVAMEGDGPATSGSLRNPGLIVAGQDCVAIDSVLALIMGIKPLDVLTNREASRRQAGVTQIESIEISGERLENAIGRPFKLPTASLVSKIPAPLARALRRMIRYYLYARQDRCIRCGACIQTCPERVIAMKGERIVFDYSGCIACFCCQEVCPAAAIGVRKSLLAKIIGL